MTGLARIGALLSVVAGVMLLTGATLADTSNYPSRIDFPAPTVDPTTGAVTTNFSPEGMAISGNTFYAGSTQTGEIIKGDLRTGAYQRNWVPASPAQPSDLHRGTLGLLVDGQNRLWVAGSQGMACGGTGQPACPAGTPTPQFNYGVIFVYDATTGAELAQFTTTNARTKTMNDITISHNAVFVSNTAAPGVAGTENQIKIQLGPGGSLPPGDTPPPGNTGTTTPCGTTLCPTYKNPAVSILPTPGFTGADGIDTLPNGNVLFTSFNGTSSGQMISMDPLTGAFAYIAVTAADRAGTTAPPLLALDGVTLDGNMLYAPENRTDTATCPPPNDTLPCPGDWAAVHLDPPLYLTAQVVARLNSPPGSGLPPLRSPANMEQLGHLAYGITRVLLTNPVTGAQNVTQTFIEHLDKVALSAVGLPATAAAGAAFSGPTATFTDPNNGPVSGDYPQNGSSVYGYRATIDWGDGTTSAGTVTGSNGAFTVSGTHTYAAAGTYTVTTSVIDAATGFTLVTATSTATVFGGAPSGGTFVIGDKSATGTVQFWGAQWAKVNNLSGGNATASFKGFAESPAAPSCGAGWSTDPGNSAGPPAGPLPEYMAVIVTSSISKSGSQISGDTQHVVVVKTNPGYAGNPGSAGTGTVVATIC
jgi:hypothetical protein